MKTKNKKVVEWAQWTDITIKLNVPVDVAEEITALADEEPEFLRRVLIYGLTRRSIYKNLRARQENEDGC